ncbi:MAG: NfeD family protein [Kiritimatiellia bacterium]
MEFLSVKWLWLYAGVGLMLMEIMTSGFVVFFFGLAAVTVGALLFAFEWSMTVQVVLFTVLSILYLVTLRRYVKSVFLGDTAETQSIQSEYVGRVGKVVEAIRPDVPGRILLGDAEWAATAKDRIEPGAEVRVVDQRNLTLSVETL